MPVTAEALAAAGLHIRDINVAAVGEGLPLGFGVGFKVTWDDYKVTVGPGAANVDGIQVAISENTQIVQSMWDVGRVASNHYYIYLNREGEFHVTSLPPVQSTENDFYEYEPTTRARFIGRLYLDSSSKAVFATTLSKALPEVTVGSSTWLDDADYSCDNENDEIEIGAAMAYLSGAFNGGIVRLPQGSYTTAEKISLLSNIQLVGDGNGTIIFGTADAVDMFGAEGTSDDHVVDVRISNLKIDASSLTGASDVVLLSFADRTVFSLVTFDGAPRGQVVLSNADETKLFDCIFLDGSLSNAYNYITSVSSDVTIISRCEFYASASVSQNIDVIDVGASVGLRIENCYFHDFEGDADIICINVKSAGGEGGSIRDCTFENIVGHGDANTIRAIQSAVNLSQVVGCKFENVSGYHDQDNATAIRLAADGCSVTGASIHDCAGIGVHVVNTADYTALAGNAAWDCGQLVDRGHCESTTAPAVFGESAVSTSNASFARSSTEAYKGTYSYTHTITTTGTEGATWLVDAISTADLHGLLTSVTYTFEAWVYVPSGGISVGEITLAFEDYQGAWERTSSGNPAGTDAWERLTVTRAIRGAATGAVFGFAIAGTASDGEFFYVDNVRLYPWRQQNDHTNCYDDDGGNTKEAGNTWSP